MAASMRIEIGVCAPAVVVLVQRSLRRAVHADAGSSREVCRSKPGVVASHCAETPEGATLNGRRAAPEGVKTE